MPLFPPNNIDLSDIRLIASDVDGTLTQNGKFSSDFISTLLDLQSAGIKVGASQFGTKYKYSREK